MPESEETHTRLARMETELADLHAVTRTLLRAQGKEQETRILAALKDDAALREVYALVDGDRGQADIAKELAGKVPARTVQRKLDALEHEWGLIVFVTRRTPGGKVFRRSVADEVFKISRQLKS